MFYVRTITPTSNPATFASQSRKRSAESWQRWPARATWSGVLGSDAHIPAAVCKKKKTDVTRRSRRAPARFREQTRHCSFSARYRRCNSRHGSSVSSTAMTHDATPQSEHLARHWSRISVFRNNAPPATVTYNFCGENVFNRHFFVDTLDRHGRQDSSARIASGLHWNWQRVPCTRRWTYS